MERPEPAFQTHAHDAPRTRGDAGRLLAHLEMHLARTPRDLGSHTRRVTLACRIGDAEATYGALVDLFIALAERGEGLKSALLARTALQLGQAQRRFLARHLASGVKADETIDPPASRSVLTRGLLGLATPAL